MGSDPMSTKSTSDLTSSILKSHGTKKPSYRRWKKRSSTCYRKSANPVRKSCEKSPFFCHNSRSDPIRCASEVGGHDTHGLRHHIAPRVLVDLDAREKVVALISIQYRFNTNCLDVFVHMFQVSIIFNMFLSVEVFIQISSSVGP